MCDCFTCRNRDNDDILMAYYQGYAEATRSELNALKEAGIKRGSIGDDGLPGEYACAEYNYQTTLCLLHDLRKKTGRSL